MRTPKNKDKSKEKLSGFKKKLSGFKKKVKPMLPGKGRWLKKLLFDVEGESGTDNRKKLKL